MHKKIRVSIAILLIFSGLSGISFAFGFGSMGPSIGAPTMGGPVPAFQPPVSNPIPAFQPPASNPVGNFSGGSYPGQVFSISSPPQGSSVHINNDFPDRNYYNDSYYYGPLGYGYTWTSPPDQGNQPTKSQDTTTSPPPAPEPYTPPKPLIYTCTGTVIPAGNMFFLQFDQNGKKVQYVIYTDNNTKMIPPSLTITSGKKLQVDFYHKDNKYYAQTIQMGK